MSTSTHPADNPVVLHDIDPPASPVTNTSTSTSTNTNTNTDTTTTPATSPSSPGSPFEQFDPSNKRFLAKKKLATLTLEEKVSLLTAADFWRTKAIPEKNIPAIKTSDGPNGARGSVFVGGTKVGTTCHIIPTYFLPALPSYYYTIQLD